MHWSQVPPQATGDDTNIYDGAAYEADGSLVLGGDQRLMIAHLPDITSSSSSVISSVATIESVPNGTVFNNITVDFVSDEIPGAPLTSNAETITASSAVNVNLRLGGTYFRGIQQDGTGTDGAVYQLWINVIGGHPSRTGADAVKGAAAIEDNFNFDIDLSAFGDNARIFDFGSSVFGYDGAIRMLEVNPDGSTTYGYSGPAGSAAELASYYNHDNNQDHATPFSGDWTASQTTAGEAINVTISGADTSGSTIPKYNYWSESPLPASEISW